MHKAAILVFAISALSVISGDPVARIIGGTNQNLVSYMVSVQSYGQHVCGGVMMSEEYVLTAASCVSGKHNMSFTIRQKSVSQDEQGDVKYVRDITIHPEFDADYNIFNVAMLKVQGMTYARSPAFASAVPAVDTDVTVYGWGQTVQGSGHSKRLQSVKLKYVAANTCSGQFGTLMFKTNHMLCTKFDPAIKSNTCEGDQGGPALNAESQLLGIVSSSHPCSKTPTIYSSLVGNSPIVTWIRILASDAGKQPPAFLA